MVAHYIPRRLMGCMMGIWYLSSALAMVLGGFVASLTQTPVGSSSQQTLHAYTHVFLEIGIAALIMSFIMLSLIPYLKRKIQA
jgi:POT family proton-dependent oligopeptide transporter